MCRWPAAGRFAIGVEDGGEVELDVGEAEALDASMTRSRRHRDSGGHAHDALGSGSRAVILGLPC